MCSHQFEISPSLFYILHTRTCPTMVISFALGKDDYALALYRIYWYHGGWMVLLCLE